MMMSMVKKILFGLLIATITGCAYLGFHGPSIRSFPDIHQGITEDDQCLQCHHADDGSAPPTPHPSFTGCLKCHNDKTK